MEVRQTETRAGSLGSDPRHTRQGESLECGATCFRCDACRKSDGESYESAVKQVNSKRGLGVDFNYTVLACRCRIESRHDGIFICISIQYRESEGSDRSGWASPEV